MEGFTVYESSTLKPVLEFNRASLERERVELGNRRFKHNLVSHMAFNLQGTQFFIVFEDSPNTCFLYNLDLLSINKRRREALREFELY